MTPQVPRSKSSASCVFIHGSRVVRVTLAVEEALLAKWIFAPGINKLKK